MRSLFFAGGSLLAVAGACVGDSPEGDFSASSSSGNLDSGTLSSSGSPPGDPDARAPGDDANVDPQFLSAVAVSAGATHTCAVLADGGVVCWGSNANGELGSPAASLASSSLPIRVRLPGRASQVAAGDRFNCALLETGGVSCWGNNEFGQLGRVPLGQAGGVGSLVEPPLDERAPWAAPISLTAGASHMCATIPGEYSDLVEQVTNHTWCWGKNSSRQLQRYTNISPSAVPLLALLEPTDETDHPFYSDTAVAGADFTCTIAYIPYAGGFFGRGIMCWGAASKQQTGKVLDPATPVFGMPAYGGTPYLANPRMLAVGAEHGCTIADRDGGVSLFCWGAGSSGATGTTTTTAADGVAFLVSGSDASKITQLAAGGANTCAVEGGTTKCMGGNQSGQLGDGSLDTNSHTAWSTVDVPPTVSSLSVGGEHVCAVFGGGAGQAGEVRCWGSNRAGQLGDGVDLNVGYAEPPTQKFVRALPVTVRAPKP